MTGKDIIRAKERVTLFMVRRRIIRLGSKLWIQRMVDVGTLRREK